MIRSIVLASQAVQAAFIEAKNAGAEDVANALRLAQFRLDDALLAAIPSNTDGECAVSLRCKEGM